MALVVLGALVSARPLGTRRASAAPLRPAARAVAVSVTWTRGRAVPVPPSFLGVSTEYWALPIWERHVYLLERALSLLHVPREGALTLRIGGDSADEALWNPRERKVPDWVVELTPSWLARTRTIVRGSGVRLILDLNTVTATPSIATDWAQAAETALPRGSVTGFEIGNEGDLYDRPYWMSIVGTSDAGEDVLPRDVTAGGYVHDFRAYARALAAVAPGVAVMGPAVAHPRDSLDWTTLLLRHARDALGAVTGHTYPYSACSLPGTSSFPTIRRLLSEAAITRMTNAVRSTVRLAHRAGLPFRLSELNSVTCRGRRGVSNAFATALWAPDALFELVRLGVNAVNVHVRPRTYNAAFAISDQGLQANPLMYGLLAFVRTVSGGDPRLVPLRVAARGHVDLKAWGVRVRGNVLHLLLIDKSARPARVSVQVPARGPATVQRLLAPSARSTRGETLAGQQLAADASWRGQRDVQTIRPVRRAYTVVVPRASAALVSLPLRRGA